MIRQRAAGRPGDPRRTAGGPGDPGARGGRAGPAGPEIRRRAAGSRRKAVLLTAGIVAVAAGLAWALLGPSLLVVRSVTVTGAGPALRAQVLRAAGIRLGTPLIRLSTGQVARQVDRLTLVRAAQVSRDWPDTVTITVRPREPALSIASAGRFEIVDQSGVVLATAASRPARLPLLTDPPAGPLRGSRQVRAAALVAGELPARLRARLVAVIAPAADQVRLRLRGGITIAWGGPPRRAEKVAELRILMRRAARYYDVSAPGSAATSG